MKFLKGVLLFVLVVIGGLLLAAIFLPKEYKVERNVEIAKSSGEVFSYLKLLKNQDNFSVWAKMDPDMKKTFVGTDGTVGFKSAWSSEVKDVGRGEQEIMKIEEGKRIDYELRFIEPFEAKDQAYFLTESISETATSVTWGFAGRMDYPKNLLLVVMNMEEMLGGQLGESLENLKKLHETSE